MSAAPPADELASAEATLTVLRQVLEGISAEDLTKQTPCREFDVSSLTDHLMNSITSIGGAVGAEFPQRDTADPVEHQIMHAARLALNAWHRRGLDGTVSLGPNETPAATMAGILSIEFLVHAWDYAAATGQRVDVPDEVSQYVLSLVHRTITPEGRATVGFDQPIELPGDAKVFDRLLAYTGRAPEPN